jgi:hypothetical protein
MVQHGCPMLIQINDSRICLRREDARMIGAQVVAEAPATQPNAPDVTVGKLAVS